MTKYDIVSLVSHLPLKNAVFADSGLLSDSILRVALKTRSLQDPAFPWKFVRTFSEAKSPLPKVKLPGFILRAYEVCRGGSDASIEAAIGMTLPGNGLIGAILDSLLLCDDLDSNLRPQTLEADLEQDLASATATIVSGPEPLSFQAIADLTGTSIETVHDYHDLFFNVRDRMSEQLFISGLVYPQSKLELLRADFQQNGPLWQKLRIAGYERGAKAVLELAGISEGGQFNLRSADELKRLLIQDAVFALQNGQHDSPLIPAAIKMAENYNPRQIPDSEMGLTALSLLHETDKLVKAFCAPQVEAQLRAQREALAGKDIEPKPSDASAVRVYSEEETAK